MKIEQIARILDVVPGVTKDGANWVIPDEIELSVFVGLPSEVLTVPRCARVEGSPDLVGVETHKGDRFWFAVADVVGVKSSAPEHRSAGRGAGFR